MAKRGSIWIGEEAYKYLLTISITQRCHKTPDEETLEKKWRCKLSVAGKDNEVQITDNDLGGVNSAGRWCSWSLQEMEGFLKEKGLKWREGEKIEYVSI